MYVWLCIEILILIIMMYDTMTNGQFRIEHHFFVVVVNDVVTIGMRKSNL